MEKNLLCLTVDVTENANIYCFVVVSMNTCFNIIVVRYPLMPLMIALNEKRYIDFS